MNLQSKYLGLTLTSPVVVAACPLSEKIDNIRKMEDAGAGAVVLFSLFEEQIKQSAGDPSPDKASQTGGKTGAFRNFPELNEYHVSLEKYLELIRQGREQTDLPVIASLNGISNDGWSNHALQLEQAGASALELNVFFIPTDLTMDGRMVEQRYIDILENVKQTVGIPVSIKLNPYFSATGHLALRLSRAGADGLVLFNRFYQPDYDIDQLSLDNRLSLSHRDEIRLPLLWLAVLYGQTRASLAATTGVETSEEVIKYILSGANVVMTASALLRNGIDFIRSLNFELDEWMERHGFEYVDEFRGMMSHKNIDDPTRFERANYIRNLEGFLP